MRPMRRDPDGTLRFVGNAVVMHLLDAACDRGYNLNHLLRSAFPQADLEEFYQLIGYSLGGYHELSLVSDNSAKQATQEARKIDPNATGCRDVGCEIHCGVREEKSSS